MPNPDVEHYAGQWCVAGAYQLLPDEHQFVEIAESDPCTTDVWGVHGQGPKYRDLSGGPTLYPAGYITYNGPCSNTNIWAASENPPYWIDDRETTRDNGNEEVIWDNS